MAPDIEAVLKLLSEGKVKLGFQVVVVVVVVFIIILLSCFEQLLLAEKINEYVGESVDEVPSYHT